MRRIIIFVLSLITWSLLVWPVNVQADSVEIVWSGLIAGVFASLIVAVLFNEVFVKEHTRAINPLRYFWFLVYIPVFAFYCILANIDVVYRAIHPEMPINPGIVKIRTTLDSNSGITALANSITLTPGTLTVDVDAEEKILYVHWINVETTDVEAASEKIAGRFEGLLRRIFE